MISHFNDARMSSKRCLTNQKVSCSEVLEDVKCSFISNPTSEIYCIILRIASILHCVSLWIASSRSDHLPAFYISTKFGKSVISWRNHDVADSSKRLMVSSILVVCFFVPHQPALLRIKISHLQRYIHLKEVNVPLAEIT